MCHPSTAEVWCLSALAVCSPATWISGKIVQNSLCKQSFWTVGMILFSVFSIFEFQRSFVTERCSPFARQMRWHSSHKGNMLWSFRHRSLLLFSSSKVNQCFLSINVSMRTGLGFLNCAFPEDGPAGVSCRECSLSLTGVWLMMWKQKVLEKLHEKKNLLSSHGKCECLKITFLSCTGNKQSQIYLWKTDINSYLKIALLLALSSRKMSAYCDLPAGAFSLHLLQHALRDVVYGNLHLGAIPIKSHAGATGEKAVMHCREHWSAHKDEQVKHLDDSSGVSPRPFKLMCLNSKLT